MRPPRNDGGERPEREKRRIYMAFFVVALAIDLITSLVRGMPYQPSLIGLAIMITAALFFVWSWLRHR